MTTWQLSPLFSWRSAVCDSTLPPVTRHVALTLSLHMNERGGSCFPSLATLARETGLHEDTIKVHLRSLRQTGWLQVEHDRAVRGRGTRNTYTATVPTRGAETTGGQSTGGQNTGALLADQGGGRPPSIEDDMRTTTPPNPPTGGTARVASPRRRTTADPLSEAERGPEFDRWYAAYPRKVGKLDAVRAWRQMLRTLPVDVDELIRSAAAMGRVVEREHPGDPDWRRYVPHPATWLRAGRWEDEIEAGSTAPAVTPTCAVCGVHDPCANPCRGAEVVHDLFNPEEECPWRR